MTTFTLFSLVAATSGSPIEDLLAGRYVLRGEFISPRSYGGENDLILRSGDLAIAHSDGALYAVEREAIGRIGYVLDLIGLSTRTLRPLSEIHSVESQDDEALFRRPTAMRVVARDRDRAIGCLIAVPCREIYRNHSHARTLLDTGGSITFTSSELSALVRITLIAMSASRIDPRTGRPPRSHGGEDRTSITGFHDIFESIVRAKPAQAAA